MVACEDGGGGGENKFDAENFQLPSPNPKAFLRNTP